MDINNMNFKGTDVVKILLFMISAIWFGSTALNRLNNVADNQTEMRKTQVDFVKDYYTDRDAMKNQINSQGIEIKMLALRLEALEKKK